MTTCVATETAAIIVGGVLAAVLIISIAVTVSVIFIAKSHFRNVSLSKLDE